MNFSQLCEKEVVSLATGAKLGRVDDAEFDEHTAEIKRLIIYGRPDLLGLFGKSDDLVIEWADIDTVGNDIILVKNETERARAAGRRGR